MPIRTRTQLVLALVVSLGCNTAGAGEPVALRAENLLVQPSTGPVALVAVKNLQDVPYQGTIALKPPSGWRIVPATREVSLTPGQSKRVPFAVERGRDAATNSYAVEVTAAGAGTTVVRKQHIVVASAPYFQPTIDGDPAEWKDAIPVKFRSGGKRTTIGTYWNRRRFAILVAVEEDQLIRPDQAAAFDAVQVAIAPEDAVTGRSPDDAVTRFEFLLVAADDAKGRCYRLASPGMKLAAVANPRPLGPLAYEDAEVAVRRTDGVTYYECSIPFRPMREQIRPSEGREFRLSVLIHDPDGTGIRDWGEAAGLWPSQRNALAWSRWGGARWGDKPPMDSKIEWGLCSSRY